MSAECGSLGASCTSAGGSAIGGRGAGNTVAAARGPAGRGEHGQVMHPGRQRPSGPSSGQRSGHGEPSVSTTSRISWLMRTVDAVSRDFIGRGDRSVERRSSRARIGAGASYLDGRVFLDPPNPARSSPPFPFEYRPSRVVLPHTLHSYISSPRGITSGSGTVVHDLSRAPHCAQVPAGDAVDLGGIVGTGFAGSSIHRAHTMPFLSVLICTDVSFARCSTAIAARTARTPTRCRPHTICPSNVSCTAADRKCLRSHRRR